MLRCPSTRHPEEQYLDLVTDLLNEGVPEESRNGLALTGFGAAMRFSLAGGAMPLLTTKRVAWKTCLRELLWFVSGSTNNEVLRDQGVKIWNANGSREFLDGRGLQHLAVDDLGPVYGHQWRHFNAPYGSSKDDYEGQGVDQLANVVALLSDPATRTSRRIVMSAWNPCQIHEMALPPCHVLAQFHVSGGDKLSCALYQRSGDVGLGVPFNIASYAFLTHLLAHHCALEASSFVYFLGNCHIYDDHVDAMRDQSTRVPMPFPTVSIERRAQAIDKYETGDFILRDYSYHPAIRMELRQ
jgi:thymidylate synthase